MVKSGARRWLNRVHAVRPYNANLLIKVCHASSLGCLKGYYLQLLTFLARVVVTIVPVPLRALKPRLLSSATNLFAFERL